MNTKLESMCSLLNAIRNSKICKSVDSVNSKNVILEMSLLCGIYVCAACIHMNEVNNTLLFVESIFMSFAYFGAYFFLPKRDFEFKTVVLLTCAALIALPAISLVHDVKEVLSIYELILIMITLFGAAFQSGFDHAAHDRVIVIADTNLTPTDLENIEKNHDIKCIVYNDLCDEFSNNYKIFTHLKQANTWLKIRRRIPFLKDITRVIYFNNTNIQRAIEVISFAKENNLDISNKFGEPFKISDFRRTRHYDIGVFNKKTVVIEYNCHPIMIALIKQLNEANDCNIIVACTEESFVFELEKMKLENNISHVIAPLENVIKNTSRVDFVFAISKLMKSSSFHENQKYGAGCNVNHYMNIIRACDEKHIRNVFLISNTESVKSQSWAGISQRVAELFAQDYSYCSKTMNIVPIRIPNHSVDLNRRNGTIVYTEHDYIDYQLIEDTFIKFIVYLIKQRTLNVGKVYTIRPNEHIHREEMLTLSTYINNNTFNKVEYIEPDDFPSINEATHGTKIDGVVETDFVSGHTYNIDDLSLNGSVADIGAELLSFVKIKTNPYIEAQIEGVEA